MSQAGTIQVLDPVLTRRGCTRLESALDGAIVPACLYPGHVAPTLTPPYSFTCPHLLFLFWYWVPRVVSPLRAFYLAALFRFPSTRFLPARLCRAEVCSSSFAGFASAPPPRRGSVAGARAPTPTPVARPPARRRSVAVTKARGRAGRSPSGQDPTGSARVAQFARCAPRHRVRWRCDFRTGDAARTGRLRSPARDAARLNLWMEGVVGRAADAQVPLRQPPQEQEQGLPT